MEGLRAVKTWPISGALFNVFGPVYWPVKGVSVNAFRKVLLQSRSCPGSMSEAISTLTSPQGEPGSIPAGSSDFGKWGSCRTMPLVGGSSRGSPVSPASSFRHHSIFTSITLIVSQELAIKSRPNLFAFSLLCARENEHTFKQQNSAGSPQLHVAACITSCISRRGVELERHAGSAYTYDTIDSRYVGAASDCSLVHMQEDADMRSVIFKKFRKLGIKSLRESNSKVREHVIKDLRKNILLTLATQLNVLTVRYIVPTCILHKVINETLEYGDAFTSVYGITMADSELVDSDSMKRKNDVHEVTSARHTDHVVHPWRPVSGMPTLAFHAPSSTMVARARGRRGEFGGICKVPFNLNTATGRWGPPGRCAAVNCHLAALRAVSFTARVFFGGVWLGQVAGEGMLRPYSFPSPVSGVPKAKAAAAALRWERNSPGARGRVACISLRLICPNASSVGGRGGLGESRGLAGSQQRGLESR
ncbi:hypothetical protein PR048_003519 [Dryococelus australis]|uniref:Uncharacterized protein n=1 Tax=Dryococelus australis TaxID=614101 RepID=A0ABQ9INC8_9NEOP|nr:hypothetical protein PR048_003519 [Dryococelus australis]